MDGHDLGPDPDRGHVPDRAAMSLVIGLVIWTGSGTGTGTGMVMESPFLSSFPPPPPPVKMMILSLIPFVQLPLSHGLAPFLCLDHDHNHDHDHDPCPDHDLWQGHHHHLQGLPHPEEVVLQFVLLVVRGQAEALWVWGTLCPWCCLYRSHGCY